MADTSTLFLPGDTQQLTMRCETDTRMALSRGLREYLETLSLEMVEGRKTRFQRVFEVWAESEVQAKFPSALVYAPEPGLYDSAQFTPSLIQATGGMLRSTCEFVQSLVVDAWSTDPLERMIVSKMLEQAFNPDESIYGFRLQLPHYYGAVATFEPQAMAYVDSEGDAQRRYRRVTHVLLGRVSVYVTPTVQPALFDPRLSVVEVTDTPNLDVSSIGYTPELDPNYGTASGPVPGAGVKVE